MITLFIPFLLINLWWGNPEGNQSLWNKLADLETKEGWQIIVGGNEIIEVSIKLKKGYLIITKSEEYNYSWAAATLAPDGKLIAARRHTEPDGDSELVLIDWKKFSEKGGKIEKLINAPLPNYEVGGFTWSPNGDAIIFEGRSKDRRDLSKPHDWQDKETPEKVFLFNLKNFNVKEIDVKNVYSIRPNSWSRSDKLVYEGPEDHVSVYDMQTRESKILAPGWFPTWNSSGTLITFQNLQARDYYTIKPDGTNKELLMTVSTKGHENGGSYGPIIWSPDDRYFMYGKQTGWTGSFDDLYVKEYATGEEVKVCSDINRLWYGSGSWIATKKSA